MSIDSTGARSTELPAVLAMFTDLGSVITGRSSYGDAVQAVAETALDRVPGVHSVSVTHGVRHGFATLAATDATARAADRLQFTLGTGPCLAAAVSSPVVGSDDLLTETRWDGWGPRVATGLGVRSVLAVRLTDQTSEDLAAALNLYSRDPDAFDESSRLLAMLLATHAAQAVSVALLRDEALNLRQAVETNREIGAAVGVLMATRKLTREQAFDILRIASQNQNRKLRDIATDVVDTGLLALPR